MTPDEWRRIEEVFQSAVELAPAAQAPYLDEACGDNAALRREVESLIEALEESHRRIEAPIQQAAEQFTTQDAQMVGRRIGPYRVTAVVGQGGMGTVFRAIRDDEEFTKEVAIKIVRQGMDTDFLRQRFLQERQILAQLEHPHITRLLDGGSTEDGLPYLVMEFVEGVPITEYCESRKLSIARRLRLFALVCAAVQHAHRNLIVHRDLKPGNILVTPDGIPKLLDFGIAKMLAPEEGATGPQPATVVRMLTPENTSPEQVQGLPITAATDVYALGTILYEMLTTRRAHRLTTRTPMEIEQVVCREEPQVPSAASKEAGQPLRWQRQISGDLDNVVLMAMRKEPQRRYNSAEQMAQDIQRHLSGLPVMARPDTFGYRAGKFLRRNRLPLALAAMLLMSLAAGMFTTLREARRAARRFEEVRGLARTMLFDVHDKLQQVQGATEARAALITNVASYLDRLSREASGDASLHRELAAAYEKVGDVQGSPYTSNLGQLSNALESYGKCVRHWQSAAQLAGKADLDTLKGIARGYYRIGDIQFRSGDRTSARQSFSLGLEAAQDLPQSAPAPDRFRLLAGGYNRLSDLFRDEADLRSAMEVARKSAAASDEWHKVATSPSSLMSIASSQGRLGDALLAAGDLNGSEAAYRVMLKVYEQPNSALRREVIPAILAVGNVLGQPEYPNHGDIRGAMEYYRRGLAVAEEFARADTKNAQSQFDLGIAYMKVGTLLIDSDPRQAAVECEKATHIFQALAQADPKNAANADTVRFTLQRWARALLRLGRHEEAKNLLLQAQEVVYKAIHSSPNDPLRRRDLSELLVDMARFQMAVGNHTAAVDQAKQSVANMIVHKPGYRRTLLEVGWESEVYQTLGEAFEGLAGVMKKEENLQLAMKAHQDGLNLWTNWLKDGIASTYTERQKASATRRVERVQVALAKLRK